LGTPTQRAVRKCTIAPHRQAPHINTPQWPSLVSYSDTDRTGNAITLQSAQYTNPSQSGPLGARLDAQGASIRHTLRTQAFASIGFSMARLPYRVTVQTHSYFACVVRRGQATRPLHTGNGVTQPVIRPHGPALDGPAFSFVCFRFQPRCTAQHSGRLLHAITHTTDGTATRGDATVTCIVT
jgi:hypothetical protein